MKPIHWLLFVVFNIHVFIAAIVGNHEIFDELYYHPAAIQSIHFVAANIEHPPLVKLIVGASIVVGGDWWLMWRLPIILFAVGATFLTYLIARRFLSERLSFFSVGLVSLSTIFCWWVLLLCWIFLVCFLVCWGSGWFFGLTMLWDAKVMA
jgi:predicted membrane-bound dolichyl-phosphate-mannose-protein mannosyltransferase